MRKTAEICLYGTTATGAGWLATTDSGKLLGTGEPMAGRGYTAAVWLACDAIREAGNIGKKARIYEPSGQRMADTDLTHPGYYGDLKWMPATVYLIEIPKGA